MFQKRVPNEPSAVLIVGGNAAEDNKCFRVADPALLNAAVNDRLEKLSVSSESFHPEMFLPFRGCDLLGSVLPAGAVRAQHNDEVEGETKLMYARCIIGQSSLCFTHDSRISSGPSTFPAWKSLPSALAAGGLTERRRVPGRAWREPRAPRAAGLSSWSDSLSSSGSESGMRNSVPPRLGSSLAAPAPRLTCGGRAPQRTCCCGQRLGLHRSKVQ